MPPEISEKTRVPLGILATVVGLVLTLAGWAYGVSTKIDTHIATDAEKWLRECDHQTRQDEDIRRLFDLMDKNAEMLRQILERDNARGK